MREIVWVVDSVLKDLRTFPDKAWQTVGYALSEAQAGRKSDYAKPYAGYSADGVFEVAVEDTGDAYRALYAVKIDDNLYVLHCFNKKSAQGAKVPKSAKATIDLRLKRAKEISKEIATRSMKAAREQR